MNGLLPAAPVLVSLSPLLFGKVSLFREGYAMSGFTEYEQYDALGLADLVRRFNMQIII